VRSTTASWTPSTPTWPTSTTTRSPWRGPTASPVDAEHAIIHAVPRLTAATVHTDPLSGRGRSHHVVLTGHPAKADRTVAYATATRRVLMLRYFTVSIDCEIGVLI
jgi:hypothetical protein